MVKYTPGVAFIEYYRKAIYEHMRIDHLTFVIVILEMTMKTLIDCRVSYGR